MTEDGAGLAAYNDFRAARPELFVNPPDAAFEMNAAPAALGDSTQDPATG
jgi:hypothetical protein